MDQTTIKQAQDMLFDAVYLPVFLKTAAELGLSFSTDEQLMQALQNVHLIKLAEAKAAAEQPDIHSQANAMLRGNAGQEKSASTNDADFIRVLQATEFPEVADLDKAAAVVAKASA